MKLFISYIKTNLKNIFLFVVFIILFCIVFSLYDLYLESIFYSGLLCLCFWVLFVIFDFIIFCKKYKKLSEIENLIIIDNDLLPKANNLIEQKYINIIHTIFKDRQDIISKHEIEKNDIIDYYTLWVHQIKTPISAMRLIMQSEAEIDKKELSLEIFKTEQYVDMVLNYLRIDSNINDFVLKQHNLDNIIKQALRKYAKFFIIKKLELKYTDLNITVLTDEKWLLFVIEQVLSNALKYTNKGYISIYVATNSKTLIIEDTGIGISNEDIPRIFSKGYTGYNGRAFKKSTGIGLYLCKKALLKLSHEISIQSQIGKGTKVIINMDTVDFI